MKTRPAIDGQRIIWRADHNVLGTAPKAAAAQVLKWIAKSNLKVMTDST